MKKTYFVVFVICLFTPFIGNTVNSANAVLNIQQPETFEIRGMMGHKVAYNKNQPFFNAKMLETEMNAVVITSENILKKASIYSKTIMIERLQTAAY